MLVGLGSAARPVERGPATRFSGWAMGLVLLVAAAGGAWWWNGQPATTASTRMDQPAARPIDIAAVREAVKPVLAVGSAVDADSVAARIEAAPDARPGQAGFAAPPMIAASASEPVALPPKVMTAHVARALPDKGARATPRLATRVDASTSGNGAPLLPATRRTVAAVGAAIASDPGATAISKDADIVLLSALLAHLTRDGQAGSLAPQTQLTIAQVVQRCEARDGKDTAAARDCRRRICDGYWGKAEACPARLAPHRD